MSNQGSARSSSRPADRYGEPKFRRTALAPGLLGAIVLLVGFALLDSEAFIWIQFAVSILALIIAWFASQARHWWWIPVMLALAVVWNPIYPLGLSGPLWVGAQYLAILAFVLAGVFIKVPVTDDEAKPGAKPNSQRR